MNERKGKRLQEAAFGSSTGTSRGEEALRPRMRREEDKGRRFGRNRQAAGGMQTARLPRRTPRITKEVRTYVAEVCVSMDNELPLLLGCLLPLMSYRSVFCPCTARAERPHRGASTASSLASRNAKALPGVFILGARLKSEFVESGESEW